MATGGNTSSLIVLNQQKNKLPFVQGKESTGVNSIAVQGNTAILVGGNFANDTSSYLNCAIINFTSKNTYTISQPIQTISGYKSSVTFVNDSIIVACGTSGVDIS
jgi:hypothetical protein